MVEARDDVPVNSQKTETMQGTSVLLCESTPIKKLWAAWLALKRAIA
jgi:hypothetical protein